jgi:hypothetical protein
MSNKAFLHRRSGIILVISLGLLIVSIIVVFASWIPWPTQLISGPVTDPPSNTSDSADKDSKVASISYNGKYVVFDSDATNLVSGDGNGVSDIFLYDFDGGHDGPLITDLTLAGDKDSTLPVISRAPASMVDVSNGNQPDDGRYIVFQSNATNIDNSGVPDNNIYQNIYLFDSFTLEMRRVSLSENKGFDSGPDQTVLNGDAGSPGKLGWTYDEPFVSNPVHPGAAVYVQHWVDNGTQKEAPFVIFESQATNLTATGGSLGNATQQIYLRNVLGKRNGSNGSDSNLVTTTLLSRNASGDPANGDCTFPVVSYNGRFIAFLSRANNLLSPSDNVTILQDSGDPNKPLVHLYLTDRDFDNDGIFDEYNESANNPPGVKVYLLDMKSGASSNRSAWSPSMSLADTTNPADGIEEIRVAFQSQDNTLVSPNPSGRSIPNISDIYVFELVPGTASGNLYRVSRNSQGVDGNAHSRSPSLSGNGKLVSFSSFAWNLVSGDNNFNDTNCQATFQKLNITLTNCTDVFTRDITDLSRTTAQIWRDSVTDHGEQGWFNSVLPSLSGTGQYNAFISSADLRLTSRDPASHQVIKNNVFRRDRGDGTGNPNIQPSAGFLYAYPKKQTSAQFDVYFLDALTINSISITNTKTNPLTGKGYFYLDATKVDPLKTACTVKAYTKDDACEVAIVYEPDTLAQQAGTLELKVQKDVSSPEYTVYIALNGAGVSRYLPFLIARK